MREKGTLFIESILSGPRVNHSRVRVTSSEGSFVESGTVTADGLNYRFNTSERSYEIVRYIGNDENGIAQFIYSYQETPLTVHFMGNRTVTTNLTESAKKASVILMNSPLCYSISSNLSSKRESEVLIRYLQSRQEK